MYDIQKESYCGEYEWEPGHNGRARNVFSSYMDGGWMMVGGTGVQSDIGTRPAK